jgi:hypothetical protein
MGHDIDYYAQITCILAQVYHLVSLVKINDASTDNSLAFTMTYFLISLPIKVSILKN